MCSSPRRCSSSSSWTWVPVVLFVLWVTGSLPDLDLTRLVWRVLAGVAIGAQLFTGLWAFADAEARGLSGWLVGGLVGFVGWPVSALVWLGVRDRYPVVDGADEPFDDADLDLV